MLTHFNLAGLKTLFLEDVTFNLFRHKEDSSSFVTRHLPNLHQLSIGGARGITQLMAQTGTPLFTRLSLPKLRMFTFESVFDDWWDSPTFPSLGAQLKVLHLLRPVRVDSDDEDDEDISSSPLPSDLSRCTQLTELFLRLRDTTELDQLAQLFKSSTQLQTLGLEATPNFERFHEYESRLAEDLTALRPPSLKLLSVPPVTHPAFEDSRQQLRKSCSDLNLKLVEEDSLAAWSGVSLARSWEFSLSN